MADPRDEPKPLDLAALGRATALGAALGLAAGRALGAAFGRGAALYTTGPALLAGYGYTVLRGIVAEGILPDYILLIQYYMVHSYIASTCLPHAVALGCPTPTSYVIFFYNFFYFARSVAANRVCSLPAQSGALRKIRRTPPWGTAIAVVSLSLACFARVAARNH